MVACRPADAASRSSDKIVSRQLLQVPYSYPVPTIGRDAALAVIQPWLMAHDIYSRGRFGAWRYEIGNTDHSVMMGVEVADHLVSGHARDDLGAAAGRRGSSDDRLIDGQRASSPEAEGETDMAMMTKEPEIELDGRGDPHLRHGGGTKISVLICTRDRPDTVGQAIESVALCDYPSFDLHVMDQSTTDETKTIVEGHARRHADRCAIHYHHLDKAGLSRAYNAGVGVSDGSVIACTDDDVIVPPTWLATIARNFEVDKEVGLLYGQVLVPSSLRAAVEAGLIVPCLEWDQRQRLCQADRNFKIWGMGANMAVRRSVFEQVGGFDEAMGGGAPLRSSQDFDFSFRTYRCGHAIVLDPQCGRRPLREPDARAMAADRAELRHRQRCLLREAPALRRSPGVAVAGGTAGPPRGSLGLPFVPRTALGGAGPVREASSGRHP